MVDPASTMQRSISTRRGLPPAVMYLAMNQPMDRVRMKLTRNIRRE